MSTPDQPSDRPDARAPRPRPNAGEAALALALQRVRGRTRLARGRGAAALPALLGDAARGELALESRTAALLAEVVESLLYAVEDAEAQARRPRF